MNENHDFLVYKDYYKENLLNHDSKIIKFGDKVFFARPTKDTKVFTGREFDMAEWWEFQDFSLKCGHHTLLDENTEVQITSIKKIQQETLVWSSNLNQEDKDSLSALLFMAVWKYVH